MAGRDRSFYRDLAMNAIPDLLERELALITPAEVEAKLADDPQIDLPPGVRRIDPHHLGWATRQLIRSGQIKYVPRTSKGSHAVNVLVPSNQHRRTRAITDAVKRKSALHARYLSWASGSPGHQGSLGPAAERIVHSALSLAAPHGYHLLNPDTGQTSMVRGTRVAAGPLDNAAILTLLDRQTNIPSGTYDVLVEVKNLRHWIYPGDEELHQLLYKAAVLQKAHPKVDFLPVLVCREHAHITMGLTNAVGAYVVRTKQQIAPLTLDPDKLAEVVDELSYNLESIEQPAPALVRHFTTLLPGSAERISTRWRTFGSKFLDYYDVLRGTLSIADRRAYQAQLMADAGVTDHTAEGHDTEDELEDWTNL